MISVHFQGKPFNITITEVYAPISNAEEAEVEQFYEDLQDLLEITPKKGVLFFIGDWNAKGGSQETPGVTGKFGLGLQNEAEQRLTRVLPRELSGHGKRPLPTTQKKTLHMDITRWLTPKSDDYILCSQRWRSSIQSANTRQGADYGSDHELLIAKLVWNWRKWRKPLDHSGMT